MIHLMAAGPSADATTGWILGVSVIAAVMSVLSAGRSSDKRAWFLVAPRLLVIGALGWLLSDPRQLVQGVASTKPRLVVMVDRSRSMSLPSRPGGVSRAEELARSWLGPDTLNRLEQVSEVRLVGFADEPTPLSRAGVHDPAEGESSRIVHAVELALMAAPRPELQATGATVLLVLSDGADSDDADAVSLRRLAREKQVRNFASGPTGPSEAAPNIAIRLRSSRDTVLRGDRVPLDAVIASTNAAGRSAILRIARVGDPAAATAAVLAERQVKLGGRTEEHFELPLDRPAGEGDASQHPSSEENLEEFVASIDPLIGESDTHDNTDRVFIRVIAKPIRVCLIDMEPSWDTAFFARAMADDPRIELTRVQSGRRGAVHIERPAGAGDGAPATLDDADLDRFDAIVLGRGVERVLPGNGADALARFVRSRGGSLVVLTPIGERSADDASRTVDGVLSALGPMIQGHAGGGDCQGGVAITEEGVRTRIFEGMGRFAPIRPIPSAGNSGLDGATSVWLRCGTEPTSPPLMVEAPAGNGRVVKCLIDGWWRWAMPMGAGDTDAGAAYARMWSRMIRWLALGGEIPPGAAASLRLSSPHPASGEAVRVTARVRSGGIPAIGVRMPMGRQEMIAMTRLETRPDEYTGEFVPKAEGVYRVEAALPGDAAVVARAACVVRDESPESTHLAARPELLASLCAAGCPGGRVLDAQTGPDDLVRELRSLTASMTAPAREEPIWNRWWVLGLVFALLAGEWWARRSMGLV